MRASRLLLGALLLAGAAQAAPAGAGRDPRHRVEAYDAGAVYDLVGHYGVVSTVFFGDDELVEVAAIGDSEAWEAVPVKGRNLVLLKPLLPKAATNLTVVTTKRAYSFALDAQEAGEGDPTFTLRFSYAPPAAPRRSSLLAAEAPAAPAPRPRAPQRRPEPQAAPETWLPLTPPEPAPQRAAAVWLRPAPLIDEPVICDPALWAAR